MRISDWSSDVCSSDLAAFIHQIDDQLHFVQALEISHFGRIASFHQRFETSGDEVGKAAAQHGLLTEQIGFALFLEGCFDDARAAAADGAGIGKRDVMGVAGRVLRNGDEAGNAAATHIFAANRSEEHTSELQSLMRLSYAVFCLKKKTQH